MVCMLSRMHHILMACEVLYMHICPVRPVRPVRPEPACEVLYSAHLYQYVPHGIPVLYNILGAVHLNKS